MKKEITMVIQGKEIIMLSKSDYDKLSELAEMNQQQIEDKAMKLWEKNGVANVKLSMEIRSNAGREIIDGGRFEFKASSYIYDGEGKFCIPDKTKERFSKMIGDWTYELMRHEFGDTLMDANKFNKKVDGIEKERKRFVVFTITGWVTAFAMLMIVIMILLLGR